MFKEDESIVVYEGGEEKEVKVSDIVFKMHDHKRKGRDKANNPSVRFAKNYFDLNLKIKSFNVMSGKYCQDTIKDLQVTGLQSSVMVSYVDDGGDGGKGKIKNVLLPQDQLVLDENYAAVRPIEGLVLVGGYVITKVVKKGNFKFVKIITTATKNVAKFDMLMISEYM